MDQDWVCHKGPFVTHRPAEKERFRHTKRMRVGRVERGGAAGDLLPFRDAKVAHRNGAGLRRGETADVRAVEFGRAQRIVRSLYPELGRGIEPAAETLLTGGNLRVAVDVVIG